MGNLFTSIQENPKPFVAIVATTLFALCCCIILIGYLAGFKVEVPLGLAGICAILVLIVTVEKNWFALALGVTIIGTTVAAEDFIEKIIREIRGGGNQQELQGALAELTAQNNQFLQQIDAQIVEKQEAVKEQKATIVRDAGGNAQSAQVKQEVVSAKQQASDTVSALLVNQTEVREQRIRQQGYEPILAAIVESRDRWDGFARAFQNNPDFQDAMRYLKTEGLVDCSRSSDLADCVPTPSGFFLNDRLNPLRNDEPVTIATIGEYELRERYDGAFNISTDGAAIPVQLVDQSGEVFRFEIGVNGAEVSIDAKVFDDTGFGDPVITLYRRSQNGSLNFVAEDDDGGDVWNASLTRFLRGGDYLLYVVDIDRSNERIDISVLADPG